MVNVNQQKRFTGRFIFSASIIALTKNSPIVQNGFLGPANYVKALSSHTIGYGTIHLLKLINIKTGIVSNQLGLGVIYFDTRGIFTEDENYANL